MDCSTTSRSRTRFMTGSIHGRRPSTYNCTSSLIPLGSLHCPSSTFSHYPNRRSSYSIRPVTPLRSFNFAFSLLYILGAGSHLHQARLRRSSNEFVSILCIAQLFTLISAATGHPILVIHIHILTARQRCPISFRRGIPEKL